MTRKILVEIICFLFILLFVYAALMKLLDYQKFVVQIGQSPLLTKYAGFVGWFIPTLELLIVGALCVPRLRLAGLYVAFSLMVMFTLYIVAILQFSEHIPCSCGGVLENMGWREHFIFNCSFVLISIWGIFLLSDPSLDKGTRKDILLQQEPGEAENL